MTLSSCLPLRHLSELHITVVALIARLVGIAEAVEVFAAHDGHSAMLVLPPIAVPQGTVAIGKEHSHVLANDVVVPMDYRPHIIAGYDEDVPWPSTGQVAVGGLDL